MEFRKIEHLRRLQIGVIGLVAVMMLVGLAAMLTDRPIPIIQTTTTDAEGNVIVKQGDNKDAGPSEPLNELGVQPAPAQNMGGGEAQKNDALPAPVAPGQNVPDLEPAQGQ